jgi:hypothetical protein
MSTTFELEDSDFEGLEDVVQQMNSGGKKKVDELTDEQKRERNRRRREKRKKAKSDSRPHAGKPQPAPPSDERRDTDDLLDMTDAELRRVKLKEKMAERLKSSRMTRMSNHAIGAFTTKHKKDGEGTGGQEDEFSQEIQEQAHSTSIAGQKISKRQMKRSAMRVQPGVYENKMKHLSSGTAGIAPGVLNMVTKKLAQMEELST